MIRMMLVESNEELCKRFDDEVMKHPDLCIIAQTASEEEALQQFKEQEIDVIILNLELNQGSGVTLLQKVHSSDNPRPFLIVLTDVTSIIIYDTIRHLGVDYIWKKQSKGFSVESILSVIEISKDYIRKEDGPTADQIRENVNRRTRMNVIRKQVGDLLEQVGFSYKYIGTKYLHKALCLVILHPELERNITKELYPRVAKECNCNAESVEKNIRVCITEAWKSREERELKVFYPFDWSTKTGRPTNLEFIRNVTRNFS